MKALLLSTVAIIAFTASAHAGGPALLGGAEAASEATAISGAFASGGSSRSYAHQGQTNAQDQANSQGTSIGGDSNKNKAYGGAVAFPAPVQSQGCFGSYGALWNMVTSTYWSAACAQHEVQLFLTEAVSRTDSPNGDVAVFGLIGTNLCKSDDPNDKRMGSWLLSSNGLGPDLGGCGNDEE